VEAEGADEGELRAIAADPQRCRLRRVPAPEASAISARRIARSLEEHAREETLEGRRLFEGGRAPLRGDHPRSRAERLRAARDHESRELREGRQRLSRIHAALERGNFRIEQERLARLGVARREDAGPRRTG
jgi:hypothetical protein